MSDEEFALFFNSPGQGSHQVSQQSAYSYASTSTSAYVPAPANESAAARSPSGIDEEARQQHVQYYFSDVRGLNYMFTCKAALNACWTVSAVA